MTRIKCCVPFCQRTYHNREGYTEWICREHWRQTSKAWRRRNALFVRRARYDLHRKMWDRLKRQAIERAAGL